MDGYKPDSPDPSPAQNRTATATAPEADALAHDETVVEHVTDRATIPIVEEEVDIDVTRTPYRVSVRTRPVKTTETVEADLESRTVKVDRLRVNRLETERPEPRDENGVTVVPVYEEVLHVERRFRVTEEIRIAATTETEHVSETVDLLRTEVDIDRVEG